MCDWRARASVAALETETNSLLIGTECVLPTVGQLEKFVTREMEAEQWVLASLFKAAQKELIIERGGRKIHIGASASSCSNMGFAGIWAGNARNQPRKRWGSLINVPGGGTHLRIAKPPPK